MCNRPECVRHFPEPLPEAPAPRIHPSARKVPVVESKQPCLHRNANAPRGICPCEADCYCKTYACWGLDQRPPTPAIEDDAGAWKDVIGSFPELPDPEEAVGAIDPIAHLRRAQDGYDGLRLVLANALLQTRDGKGKERHADGAEAFEDQKIVQVNRWLGSNHGALFQIVKKALESARLPPDRAERELLGAIVYAAAAIMTIPPETP